MFEELLRTWTGEELVVRSDEPTGAWFFVGVHSTVLGPAMGGTRLNTYGAPEDGVRDVVRLSEAMTLKQAAANLPYGGGKAVLAVPEVPPPGSDARHTILRRYADLVDSLGGTYVTAADMNTGQADMDVVGERTRFVLGRSRERGGSGDPAPGTALGVFHGIVASVRRTFGSPVLEERTVLVQGVGAVGGELIQLLHEAGATLLVSDVHGARAHDAAQAVGATVIEPDLVIGTPCDVFAPCASGPVLKEDTIPRLRCRVVAGAANNQLASGEDAERLQEADILYAPDFVINAGGVIHLAGFERFGWDEAQVTARITGIGATLERVFDDAERDGGTTLAAAEALAAERLAAGPA
ncbi:MAG TPA: Glu/Leu/Phe/Val dehydrogenase dimerization domain-containing protein [Actinomycetota bacterium]